MEIKRSGSQPSAKGPSEWFTGTVRDRKSTRLNSSHLVISYAVFCLKKKSIASRHAIGTVLVSVLQLRPLRRSGPTPPPARFLGVAGATDGVPSWRVVVAPLGLAGCD